MRTLDRVEAAKDRFNDMKARFDVAAKGGKDPIVHAELPTTCYPSLLRDTPHPFETIRVMKDVVRLGARRLAVWGVNSPPDLVPEDVNMEAMTAVNADIAADADAVVRGIAERWVGAKHAGRSLRRGGCATGPGPTVRCGCTAGCPSRRCPVRWFPT